jgi:2-oxoglutarate dehydrogenase E1 component
MHCHALQVFYELHAERERQGKQAELAIVRLEQLAPFPFDLVCRELYRYPNAEPIWCQEEPMNMGAYFHVQVCVLRCGSIEYMSGV